MSCLDDDVVRRSVIDAVANVALSVDDGDVVDQLGTAAEAGMQVVMCPVPAEVMKPIMSPVRTLKAQSPFDPIVPP